jgi:hypothetical protein
MNCPKCQNIMIGVEYFKSNYPGEHQELDFSLGLFRITFIW